MSSRFCFSEKEWPIAVRQALSDMIANPGFGQISDIDFELGHPRGGRLPFRIIVDGRRMRLCEPSDAYPFLESLRGWMERCLVFDRRGTLHPEILTIDCADAVYSVVMFHAGWEDFGAGAEPVSGIIIVRAGKGEPILFRFCRTTRTIARLYDAILDGIMGYRGTFNSPATWYDLGRFSRLDDRTTAERLLGRFRSEKIEKLTSLFRKIRH